MTVIRTFDHDPTGKVGDVKYHIEPASITRSAAGTKQAAPVVDMDLSGRDKDAPPTTLQAIEQAFRPTVRFFAHPLVQLAGAALLVGAAYTWVQSTKDSGPPPQPQATPYNGQVVPDTAGLPHFPKMKHLNRVTEPKPRRLLSNAT